MKELTVGDLRKALEGVPDTIEVKLGSDTGVDQGIGEVIIEECRRVTYTSNFGVVDYFEIYANDIDSDDMDTEDEDPDAAMRILGDTL